MMTNRGQSGVGMAAGMGKVDGRVSGGPFKGKAPPSRRGDAFIAFDEFVKYSNHTFAAA